MTKRRYVLMIALWLVIAGVVLGKDILHGRWDLATWFLAINWACWEAGLALARYQKGAS